MAHLVPSARFSRRAAVLFAALGLSAASLPACGGTDGETANPPGVGGGSGGGAASGSGGTSASGNGGSGGISLGGAAGNGTGGGSGSGCEKIDFLFIVDNSVSMEGEQALLVAAFPNFISTIENTVNAGSNYHIMVTDTDEWGRCSTANPWTGMDPGSTTCNGYIKKTVFEECDRTLGAGVVHPAGQYASNKICPIPAGRRYLQQGDTDVSGAFSCAAQVGVAGHPSERPMDSMVAAIAPAINAPGGCNDGFLRDDALLVVTFISDDPNYEDAGDPQSWYDAVVGAKHGDPNAVVVVGITPNFTGCNNGKAPHGSHWSEFVAKFPSSLEASVCSSDYASVFAQAVQIVDESCDNFVPPPR